MTITSFFGPHRWLSNFWIAPFPYRGRQFSSVEEAYQWEACATDVGKHAVLYSSSPGSAKTIARKFARRADWPEVKLEIMRRLLAMKFALPELREKLLATGEEELIEGNTWGDVYWGVCQGVGENHLGRLLMELRASLRAEVVA